LNFAVRLEHAQPTPEVIDELFDVLEFSLRHPWVTQPVEFFHSALLSFYDPYFNRKLNTLWAIQEEDPTLVRYVADDGVEIVSPRFEVEPAPGGVETFVEDFQRALLFERNECCECAFWKQCGGYFKWPRRDFACDEVKNVFRVMKEVAGELKNGIAAYSKSA